MKKAEIGTIVMMALLVIVSVIGFGSSTFLDKKQTISTKAEVKMCGSGNRFNCKPEEGYGAPCTNKTNLEFNCCVADRYDESDKTYRIRRYGCTGQFCQKTIIANALGHLVGCAGFTDGNNEEFHPLNDDQTAIVFSPAEASTIQPPDPACVRPTITGTGRGSLSCPTRKPFNRDTGWCCKAENPITLTPVVYQVIAGTPVPVNTIIPIEEPIVEDEEVSETDTPVIPNGLISPTITPISIQFKSEGTCIASGTVITWASGACRFFELTGEQNCSNSTPLSDIVPADCFIFRNCRQDYNNCQYNCFYKDKYSSYNCKGAEDPNINYDYIRIVNSSTIDKVIGEIVLEKMRIGGNLVKSLGGVTLQPNKMIEINLNDIGRTFACSVISENSVKVWLFNPDRSVLTSAQDRCAQGVKILINLL